MANGVSATWDTNVSKLIFGVNASQSAPAALYAAAGSSTFGTAKASFTEWTTSTFSNYVRESFGTGSGNWTVGSFVSGTGVTITNANQVAFPANNSASAATLAAVGFFDASSAGTLVLLYDLASSQSIAQNIQVAFFIGDVSTVVL